MTETMGSPKDFLPPPSSEPDERWMREALREAIQAWDEDEVPVGAVIVHEGKMIAKAHNLRETLKDPTAHAEIIAITQAAEALESWRLEKTTLYVTLEPCPMCAGAIINARIPQIVFGARDPKAGACGSLLNISQEPRLNHRIHQKEGIYADYCGAILSAFFQSKRKKT